MSKRQIYVVDDEDAIRRSLQLMLRVLQYEPTLFESGGHFLDALPTLATGSVLLDLRMPEIDGLEIQRRLAAAGTDHSVIVMSGHGDLAVAVTAMEQGALAFLEKPFSRASLEQALDMAFLRVEDPPGYRAQLRSAAAALQALPATERQVLELMARGQDTEGISRQIGLSAVDVEISRSRIFASLGAETVTEALHLAFAARRAVSL